MNFNFRVYDNYRQEILYWKKLSTTNSSLYTFTNEKQTYKVGWVTVTEHPKRYVFMMTTGLHDVNNKDIWMYDILKHKSGFYGLVKWSDRRAGFYVAFQPTDKFKPLLAPQKDYEIVGNYFDTDKRHWLPMNLKI